MLLERSQQQIEELCAQEEETRQNMEELSSTQEEMARVTKELEGQLLAINDTMATIEFDRESHILEANENFLNLMGYSLQEIRGKHHRLFAEPKESSSEAYAHFWSQLAQGKKSNRRVKRITNQGKVVYIRSIYNPVVDQTDAPRVLLNWPTILPPLSLWSLRYNSNTRLPRHRRKSLGKIRRSYQLLKMKCRAKPRSRRPV